MSVRRSLMPIVLLAAVLAAVASCGDPSPVGVDIQTPAFRSVGGGKTGVVTCSQGYDSVTKVIGREGGSLIVGAHQLWVDSLSLTGPVSITAVAPKGKVRWVRFQPEGLVFNPGFYATANGLTAGAALMTNYASCGVPAGSTVRLAQVSDAMTILGYLSQINLPPWTTPNQYVGLLPHFSNYAVAW
jgi:hypothetical protein